MESIKNNLFEFSIGSDGIGILTIDQKDNPTNLFSLDFINAYLELALQAIADEEVRGVILTSGRSMFMPGADLRELKTLGKDPVQQLQDLLEMHANFRAIETGGKPFVAAINGTAMGGGLELCMA